MLLYHYLNIHYTWKKKSYKSNEFKKSAPTWNDKFELRDGLYSVSDIQDCIMKHHDRVSDNSPIRICVNKIEIRMMFKIKTGTISNF